MSKVMRAIGLMSGTSLDGIDAALIETDGEGHLRRLGAATFPYPEPFRERLRTALAAAQSLTHRHDRPPPLADIERELTERHAEAALRFIGDRLLQPSAIDVIGLHGQTVLHCDVACDDERDAFAEALPTATLAGMAPPTRKLTVQLGDGPLLARLTGIDVIHDMRGADVAAGGQGAPLVPVYHRALVARVPDRPIALLNIGGVANVTWIGADGRLIAFDTGPGNALIDDWMKEKLGETCDRDGRVASRAQPDEDALQALLMAPYFGLPPPKSLDRNAFDAGPARHLPVEQGAATLTAFTAAAIARAREHMPDEPALWIVTGGGRRNKTLMRMIAARVENAVAPAEAIGLDGDGMEAEAWAYLAVRSLAGLPLSFPGTTGVPAPCTGGILARAP